MIGNKNYSKPLNKHSSIIILSFSKYYHILTILFFLNMSKSLLYNSTGGSFSTVEVSPADREDAMMGFQHIV